MEGITNSTNTIYSNPPYCIHRMPCGYCTLLSKYCDMGGFTITPTWKQTEITCGQATPYTIEGNIAITPTGDGGYMYMNKDSEWMDLNG